MAIPKYVDCRKNSQMIFITAARNMKIKQIENKFYREKIKEMRTSEKMICIYDNM